MTETATYIYCLTRSAAKPVTARVPPGLPGATRPAAVPLDRSIWLIAADVPLHTYGPAPLESALRDIQWVADIAVAHESVVEHFTRQRGAAVIPMKMFTMFSSVDRAVEEMRGRLHDVRDVFRRIAGCEEWGVRIVRAAATPKTTAQRVAANTGAAFLAAKKHARDDARMKAQQRADAAEQVFVELDALTRAAWRRTSVPDGATTPPLLDAAFLVPVKQRARFRAAAKRLGERFSAEGIDLTLTGPWPAYNFVQSPE